MYAQYVDSGSGSVVVLATVLSGLLLWLFVPIQILRKAGYSGLWAFVLFIPVVNVVMLLVFTFSEWPVQRALREATWQPPP